MHFNHNKPTIPGSQPLIHLRVLFLITPHNAIKQKSVNDRHVDPLRNDKVQYNSLKRLEDIREFPHDER